MPKLKIVVLAAGFSRRLGQPKALARIHGTSLLRRTLLLATALRAAGIVVVVPRACARYRSEGRHVAVTWVRNSRRSLGLSSSVRCGLQQCRYASAALLLPVDLAELKLGDLEGLVSRWRARRSRVIGTRLTGATGEFAAAPLILPARFFPTARLIQGDVGLREMVAGLPAAQRTLIDLPSAQTDVDTIRDLAAARRRWS